MTPEARARLRGLLGMPRTYIRLPSETLRDVLDALDAAEAAHQALQAYVRKLETDLANERDYRLAAERRAR